MLNVLARQTVSTVLDPVGRALDRLGVSPNAVTLVGTIGVLVGTIGFVAGGNLLVGLIVTTICAFTDLLDGAVARARGRATLWGAFLDSTADRVADAAIFGSLAFWLASVHRTWAAAAALACLAGALIVSYVKARAEGLGLDATVGIAERGERLIAIGVIGIAELCGLPYALEGGMSLLALACVITVGQRMWVIWKQVRGQVQELE